MSNKKYRIICILLAGLLASGLSGCSVNSSDAVSELTEQTEKKEEVKTVQEEETLPERTGSGNRLEEIEESGVLLIGISPDYAPFEYLLEDGSYAGSDIELGNYIAEQLGVEARFVEYEFDECLEAVKAGTVDMVLLGMLEQPEREKYLDFTEAYYTPGKQVLLVRTTDQSAYRTLDDLAGKTVSAMYGSLQAQMVIEQLPESYMELTDSVTDSVALLGAKTVDAIALDENVAEGLLQEYEEMALADAAFEYTGEPVAGGVVRGETDLLKRVNEIIESVTDQKLYFNWIDEAIEAYRS